MIHCQYSDSVIIISLEKNRGTRRCRAGIRREAGLQDRYSIAFDLEVRVGFEPTVELLCRQLPWTTRPPHCVWLPGRDSNPHKRFWRPLCCHYTTEKRIGCPGWARTSDQMINSHLLYLLSYIGTDCFLSAAVIIVSPRCTVSTIPSTRSPTREDYRIASAG